MEILEVMIEIITLKRQKEVDDAEQEEEFRGDQKKRYSLLNDRKFSKTKLPKLVITGFDGTDFDWFMQIFKKFTIFQKNYFVVCKHQIQWEK